MLTRIPSLVLLTASFGLASVAYAQDSSQNPPAYGTQNNSQSGTQNSSQSGTQSSQQNSHPHWLINQFFGGDSSSSNSGSSSNSSTAPSGQSGAASSGPTFKGQGPAVASGAQNNSGQSGSGNSSSANSNGSQNNPSSVRASQSRIIYPPNSQRTTGQPTTATGNTQTPLYAPSSSATSQPAVDVQSATPRDTRPLSERLRQPAENGPSVSAGIEERAPVTAGSSSRRVASAPIDVAEEVSVPAMPTPTRAPHTALAEETQVTSAPKSLGSSRRPVAAAEIAAPAPIAAPLAGSNVLANRQSPQLSVETVGPRTIMIGKEASYRVELRNTGDVAAQEVIVGVKIPEWTDVAGTQVTAGTAKPVEAEGLQWRLPRLEARSKETHSLRLVPRKGKPFDLAVQWTFTPVVEQTVVEVQEPKLAMSIAGPEEVNFGQSKVYRLTVSNPGTGAAENVAIQLSPIGNPNGAPTQQSLGTLKAGDSKVIELELTARQAGNITIHASATAEPGLKTESTEEVLVRRAAVVVNVEGAKVKYAGTTATYAIQISNPGNAPAERVHVIAVLPPEARFVSASAGGQFKSEQGKVVWTLPNLKPGEANTMELKCTLMVPGPNRIQVASNAAGDVNDTSNITTHVEALADLKLNVSEPAGPIAVGDEVVYELKIRNRGSKSAEGVGVVAYFSEGIEPLSAVGGQSDIANGVVAFHRLVSLAAGGEVVYKIHAKAERTGKQVFRAEVECGSLGTKLVNAEESTIYGDELATPSHHNEAIAGRIALPSAEMPTSSQMPGVAPIQQMPMQTPGQPSGTYNPGLRR